MDLKTQILEKSEELFLRYGLKSVTMDDIARNLGISKKTLYQYVENKSDLVQKVMKKNIDAETCIMNEVNERAGDAVEEMVAIARFVVQQLRKLTPVLMYDLQKYYQQVWLMIQELHSVEVYNMIRENIERGKEQGVYRSDVDADIIARIYVRSSISIVDELVFPLKDYKKEKLFTELIHYHISGIATEKGLRLFAKHRATNA